MRIEDEDTKNKIQKHGLLKLYIKRKLAIAIFMVLVLSVTSVIVDSNFINSIFTSITADAANSNVTIVTKNKVKYVKFKKKTYKVINVKGGDLSGTRKKNVAVDIGYGERVYWGLTNKYGQLIYVIADKITLQDEEIEKVNSDGRYYDDEAKVKGTEREDLDEGHVIADSLGGVSNAYNITPQNSTLNRYGDQAYMEKIIRDAGGCKNFIATITYPDTKTQIPSHYNYKYELNGESVEDDFDNVDPDVVNATITPEPTSDKSDEAKELKKVDTNGNGKVTIAEAKAAGFKMPITKEHWLYKYMTDGDGDGMVGE